MITHSSLSPPSLSTSSRPQLHSTPSFRAEPAPAALSPLTTRSSSTTRIARQPEWDAPIRHPQNGSNDAYRAWRREGLERKGQGDKGRGPAVVTIAGVPSSGASSSSEGSPPQPFLMGLNRMQDLVEGDVLPMFEGERGRGRQARVVPLSAEEIIKWQIKQFSPPAPAQNVDNLLQHGIADYSYVLTPETPHSPRSPRSPPTLRSPQQSRTSRNKPDPPTHEPEPHPRRVSLGKGKFSEVLLVKKGGVEYAMKHTPLHPHHPLIATRLLREPTILAQLMPHPNLVEVYETIRTPGHFYLVEENLSDHVTLEGLVASSAGGILSDELVWRVLDQLASVVRSLHEPLRVCHRDIKPDNILVRLSHPPATPPSPSPSSSPSSPRPLSLTPSGACLELKLLDFGLATHFSGSEPKLSTCCGSPAYHSPELWRSLRESPGGLRYWGPEVDIWCVGLTVLRCLTPHKYPLGINHSSLAAIQHKVTDSILAVANPEFRQILTGLLDLDGERRMASFTALVRERNLEPSWIAGSPQTPQTPLSIATDRQDAPPRPEFKSTTYIPTAPKHGLDLPLLASSQLPDGPKPLEVHAAADLAVEGASCLAPPPPIELVLLNPTDEPIRRAASYVKYVLRCAGVLYHVREDASVLDGKEDDFTLVLECAVPLPKEAVAGASKASHALIAALRPAGPVRSSSVPAAASARAGAHGNQQSGAGGKAKKEPPPQPVPTLRFFMSIKRAAGVSSTKAQKRRSAAPVAPRVVLTLSDARARGVVRDALKLDHFESPVMHSPRVANIPLPTPGVAGEETGRRGRGARGEVPVIRTDGSGSRAARDRRRSATAVGIREGLGAGLAMAMGPPAVVEEAEGERGRAGAVTGPLPSAGGAGGGGKGFFEFATGYFSGRSSVAGTPAATPGAV